MHDDERALVGLVDTLLPTGLKDILGTRMGFSSRPAVRLDMAPSAPGSLTGHPSLAHMAAALKFTVHHMAELQSVRTALELSASQIMHVALDLYNAPKTLFQTHAFLDAEDRHPAAIASKAKCENPACSRQRPPEKLRECTGCHAVRYCCSACQSQDWRAHKALCKKYQPMYA